MRLHIATGIIALSLAGLALVSPSLLAQEPDPSQGVRKVITRIVPMYPELARKMQLSGIVKVEVLVAPNGSVKATQVMGGSPVLASAAVDAIKKWRWAPDPQETKELIELHFHP